MEKDWINIYSSTDPVKIEIIQHVLSEKKIKSVVINQQDSSYLMFGTINLHINSKDKEEALKVIEKINDEY